MTVVKPGLFTTVQDLGRWGLQDRGVPVAGPMDVVSHRLANALVGNDRDAATLETTLIGPELEFHDERLVAVAGAAFDLSVDGHNQTTGRAFAVESGSRLRFGTRHAGARAYVAIGGGIAVPPVLGSRATHTLSRLGGCEGRALVAGDRLPLGVGRKPAAATQPPSFARRSSRPRARLRVLPGPDSDRFSAAALGILQSAAYRIAGDSNRMGYRLDGAAIPHAGSADIMSDATPLGAIQVPASGQPMLLMADRQTTGGYPIIAIVIAADVSIAGQLAPGDSVEFAVCTPREALRALIDQERRLMLVEGAA